MPLAMSNLRTTIETLASQFAASVLGALRSASIDELVEVAGAGGARRGPGRPRSAASDGGAASSGPRRRAGRGGRLGRRTAGDIGKMIESIVGVLAKASSGLRAEQIRETLGVEAKELPRPLAEAISTGRITKSGQKRATTYFAGGGGGAAAPKRRGRKPGTKNKKR
jgi:hypothetical protein